MPRVVSVRQLDVFCLYIAYDDGTQGMVSLQERLFGAVFEPLRDPAVFRQVFVDEFGAIAWPNGADLAPDALYEKLCSSTEVRI